MKSSTVMMTLCLLAAVALARGHRQAPHNIFLKDQEKKDDSTTFYYM
jgi:hypothetical protein